MHTVSYGNNDFLLVSSSFELRNEPKLFVHRQWQKQHLSFFIFLFFRACPPPLRPVWYLFYLLKSKTNKSVLHSWLQNTISYFVYEHADCMSSWFWVDFFAYLLVFTGLLLYLSSVVTVKNKFASNTTHPPSPPTPRELNLFFISSRCAELRLLRPGPELPSMQRHVRRPGRQHLAGPGRLPLQTLLCDLKKNIFEYHLNHHHQPGGGGEGGLPITEGGWCDSLWGIAQITPPPPPPTPSIFFVSYGWMDGWIVVLIKKKQEQKFVYPFASLVFPLFFFLQFFFSDFVSSSLFFYYILQVFLFLFLSANFGRKRQGWREKGDGGPRERERERKYLLRLRVGERNIKRKIIVGARRRKTRPTISLHHQCGQFGKKKK